MDKRKVMAIVKEVMLNRIVQDNDFRRDVYKITWDKIHAYHIPDKDLGVVTELVVVAFAELSTRIEYLFSQE